MKYKAPETRTVYYLKPGQTLENTRVSDRSLALIVPGNVYDRFSGYGTENERIALLAEREAKRLAALKEAGREMRKAQGFKNLYKKESVDIKKNRDEDTAEFMKNVRAQKAKEHAAIVKKAREEIFQNTSQCRSFNRALMVSECLKELEEQIKFQNSIKNVHKRIDEEYARSVMEDVEKFYEEEKLKREFQLKKIQTCKKELEKQIEENRQKNSATSEAMRKEELEELELISKEIKELKEMEKQEELQKKETLKKMFLSAIEEKRQQDLKVERENKFGAKVLETYNVLKCQMERTTKEKIKRAKESKSKAVDRLVKKIGGEVMKEKNKDAQSREEMENKICVEVKEQLEREALEKIADQKRKKEKIRQEILEQQKTLEQNKAKEKKEEMDLRLWEMQQRCYRDDFNKNWTLEQSQNEKKKKLAYGNLLKIQMKDQKIAKEKKAIEEDAIDAVWRKEMLEKCNERILAYGDKVLKESEGIRPIYPIAKAIHQFKKGAGLIQVDLEATTDPPSREVRRRRKQIACTPVREEDQFFFA